MKNFRNPLLQISKPHVPDHLDTQKFYSHPIFVSYSIRNYSRLHKITHRDHILNTPMCANN